jgi:hypothetical protein
VRDVLPLPARAPAAAVAPEPVVEEPDVPAENEETVDAKA